MTDYSAVTPWPVRWTCDVSTYSPTATGAAVQLATATLWGLTGRQFGLDTVTLRPCVNITRDTAFPDAWLSWPGTQMPPLGATASGGFYGYWLPALCGTCSQGCSCAGLSQVRLPAPINSITLVKIDGAVLPSSSYRVDDYRFLVRTDGFTWPRQNNLALDDTQVGTWSVAAQYGGNIPAGAAVVVGELACQYLRAIDGEDCRLPRTVTSLVRQGVTIQMPDPATLFDKGLTGLYLVDAFIKTWNPTGIRSRARTYSIDVPPQRQVGT